MRFRRLFSSSVADGRRTEPSGSLGPANAHAIHLAAALLIGFVNTLMRPFLQLGHSPSEDWFSADFSRAKHPLAPSLNIGALFQLRSQLVLTRMKVSHWNVQTQTFPKGFAWNRLVVLWFPRSLSSAILCTSKLLSPNWIFSVEIYESRDELFYIFYWHQSLSRSFVILFTVDDDLEVCFHVIKII